MAELLVPALRPVRGSGPAVEVTPASAGWSHVSFEVHRLAAGETRRWTGDERERCLVVLGGRVDVQVADAELPGLGGRPSPFDGLPAAVYVPQRVDCSVVASDTGAEIAVAASPGAEGHVPYAMSPDRIEVEVRGTGAMERRVHSILMADRPAHSLLVVEVLTPGGHWSSYPPHKHDTQDPPKETLLEETYYHRIAPADGFGIQRVYSPDAELDETITFHDGDVVLVPRGYHAVAMPPGYDGYYLNVMAGPLREWQTTDDPAHAWLRTW